MPEEQSSASSSLPCTWQPLLVCQDCHLAGDLMCRYEAKDMLTFFMNVLPFAVTVIAGTIRAGFGWYLLLWLAYALFFFFVWEARILCSHCPMWAEESRVLHCHANNGVVKLWKYRPGPMSRSERIQFLAGALLWIVLPFPFLLLGGEYLLALIGLVSAASGVWGVYRTACNRCLNFSCPMNAVPKPIVDAYLARNPEMRAAWEASGYRLDE
jgi:hypothetical protein